ncbi:MAG: gliding motility-associated ABC transporter permease subunit GldF [Saprospiraceae bacterium]|nr:gliding motility-associated ABC transporter permease subunit GldF [Saprospiraceae bacterium]
MLAIFKKEVHAFFGTLIGYLVIGVFLVLLGLIMFVFPDSSVLDYPYATMGQLFDNAPLIFLFLIPAVTMRMFAEERQNGTIEFLMTKPVSLKDIILGKYLASMALVVFALVPTLLYFFTIYQLGSPVGNIDTGAVLGSYIGLLFLAGCFTAIGLFASAMSKNQITGFVAATFLCFLLFYGFFFFSKLPVFFGRGDVIVQMLGIDFHYEAISKGVIDTRNVVYFLSVIGFFLFGTQLLLERIK